jgi:hypothetical protein
MAKPMTVSIPHELPPAEVKQRLVKAIAEARSKHGDLLKDARESWPSDNQMDFSAHALGQSVTGSILIDPSHVHVSVNLPSLISMFSSKLKTQIENE